MAREGLRRAAAGFAAGWMISIFISCGARSGGPSEAPVATAPGESSARSGAPVDGTVPPRPSLGTYEFPVSISEPEARAAFNRGVTLAYAFSHGAAEREFRRAAELDPRSPMPWWGVALVNGPHINYPLVPEDKAQIAWDALLRARALRGNGLPLEQQLVDALGRRYVRHQPKDRSGLDREYAKAMKRVFSGNPSSADVAVLTAEALMDLHPWDLFETGGKAKSWTPEIVALLEKALQLDPLHPGANHLYIHVVEASDAPERGVPSADRLVTLVPGAGHLVHMPAHIYIRVGRWEEAANANIAAIEADRVFRASSPRPGFYAVYMAHNHHFLTFVRMMQGRKKEALAAAREMIATMPPEFLREFGPIVDGFIATPFEVMMRFGEWDAILAEPEPAEQFPLARALRRFARVSALNALHREDERAAEEKAFRAAVRRVPAAATFGNNSAHALLTIAGLVLEGEGAAARREYAKAEKLLRLAARREDALLYDEPPDWIIPVRHALGQVLVKAGRFAEAEAVYREDLKKFPLNGWSLSGLEHALIRQDRKSDAAKAGAAFKAQWAAADTAIEGSCLCLR